MRHGLAEYAALVLFIEAPPRVWLCALASDDQHAAVAFVLRRFQEAAERSVGVALAHAVQVEARLDEKPSSLKLACGLPIQRFAARDRCLLRRWMRPRLDGRRRILCRLWSWLGCIDLGSSSSFVQRPRASSNTLPKLGVAFVVMFALAHAMS